METARRRTFVVAAALAILLAAVTWIYRFATLGGSLGGFENDEFVTLSLAQQATLGERPVRDFVEIAAPLTVTLSASALRIVGHTLFAEAALTIGMLALCSALLFLLAWRASGSMPAAFTVALVQIAMAPRFYNYPKLLAYAFAVPALWSYIHRPTRVRLFFVAGAGVLAFLLRLDHGAYVAAAAVASVIAAHWGDVRRTVIDGALAAGIGLLLVAPFLITVQREMGVVEYFRQFVATAQQAAGRTNFKPQSFSFDLTQPVFARVRMPPPPPRINVRWRAEADDGLRAEHEQNLGLVNGERLAGEVWNYALRDWSMTSLKHIVEDPFIADTQGVDRSQFTLNDPALLRTPSRLERLIAVAREVRVLPGVLREANAVPFLYYLMVLVPAVALILGIADRREQAAAPIGRAAVIVTAILALLIDWGFLRGNLPSRLADVTEVVGILAAWLASRALRQTSGRGHSVAVTLMVVALLLTALSVQSVENVAAQVQQTGVGNGTQGLLGRLRDVRAQLDDVPPVAAWPKDGPGIERLAWYVNQCTTAEDRVLVVSYAPELFFMAARGFAAGRVWIQPGFDDSDNQQQLMISRIASHRVPIAFTDPEPAYTEDYVESFPLLDGYLAAHYQELGTIDFGRGYRYRVLVRRDLRPSSTYESLGLPCFS